MIIIRSNNNNSLSQSKCNNVSEYNINEKIIEKSERETEI